MTWWEVFKGDVTVKREYYTVGDVKLSGGTKDVHLDSKLFLEVVMPNYEKNKYWTSTEAKLAAITLHCDFCYIFELQIQSDENIIVKKGRLSVHDFYTPEFYL